MLGFGAVPGVRGFGRSPAARRAKGLPSASGVWCWACNENDSRDLRVFFSVISINELKLHETVQVPWSAIATLRGGKNDK